VTPGAEPRRVRPKYRSRAAARARRKLAFYVTHVSNPQMGGGWLSELHSIVDDIIDAAVEAVRAKASAKGDSNPQK
jgi:hypothetical protein